MKANGRRAATRRPGFTFLEVLIVAVIMVFVAGTFMVLGTTGQTLWQRTDATLVTLQGAQAAMNRLGDDLRSARQSGLACSSNQLRFIRLDGNSVTYNRGASNQQLTRTVSGRTQVVTTGATSFVPTCTAGGLVQVSLTTQINTRQGPRVRTLESRVWVRNP